MMANGDEFEARVLESLHRLDATVTGGGGVPSLLSRVAALEAQYREQRGTLDRISDELDRLSGGEMRRTRWVLVSLAALAAAMIGLAAVLVLRGTP